MNVHCSTCGEGWDAQYLQREVIFDTAVPMTEAGAWGALPRAERLTPRYRQEFIGIGFYFGRSILNVVHCPACPDGAKPDPARLAAKAALEALIDDEDRLAAAFQAHRL